MGVTLNAIRTSVSRILRDTVWAGVVAIVSTLQVCQTAASDLPTIISRVKPAIVAVGTYEATRRPPAVFRGTGFIVHDGNTVATSAHVLPDHLDESNKEILSIFLPAKGGVVMYPARIAGKDGQHDLAILRFEGPPQPALSLGTGTLAREGQSIAFTGFPLGAALGLVPVTHTGIISAYVPTSIPVLAPELLDSKQIRSVEQGFGVYQLDAVAYPGNSGSPVYDTSSAEVLGVVASTFVKDTRERVLQEPSAMTYAIPVQHLRLLLAATVGQ